MARRSCDGEGLIAAFRAAVANLERHVDEINALNVYPVPDGDTGSNMYATVKAALDEAERVADQPAERVAQAISFGAFMGARGNSGVITSQILRGVAEGLAGKRHFNGLDLAHALSQGTKAAYGAVGRPVEGTILTVMHESSVAAVAAAEADADIEHVLTATVEAAEAAVARTPTLLAILREAGVVDSGGQGLYRLFEGALLHLVGQAPTAVAPGVTERAGGRASTLVAHADDGFGYETMFLLEADGTRLLDVDAIRTHLESIGDSVLVAGDPRAVKIHVHNDRPDLVIGYGLTLGSLSRISVENLDGQARDVREARANEFAGGPVAGDTALAPGAAADLPESRADAPPERQNGSRPSNGVASADAATLPLAVIAVAAGEGLARIFRDEFGVAAVVSGGQAANPSTGELMQAVEAVDAAEVLLLPNNPNVVMAARQVAALSPRPVHVVPTRNAAEGFAALLALDPTRGAAANAEPMTKRARDIQSLAVTEAVRDAKIGATKVKRGQTIVLDPEDGLVAANRDREKAVLTAIGTLQPGVEIVSIYYGDGATLDEAERLARKIGEACAGVEIEIFHGGQPWYRYLIAAE